MALAVYVSVSVLLFGVEIVGKISRAYLGAGHDPVMFMWLLAWWPHALSHRLNPFLTSLVWSPQGVNLTWSTAIPGASLLATPITLAFGPVVAYNVLSLLGPATAAFTAYLLCRHVTKNFWPALLGGWLYGFSPLEAAHLAGHLNLTLVFVIPLLVYLVLLRLDEAIRPPVFLAGCALGLVLQFLLSNEIFATMTLVGVPALLLAWLGARGDVRTRLGSVGLLVAGAFVLAGIVLSPYLYHMFAHGAPTFPANDPEVYSSDLLNLVIPTPVTLLGGRAFAGVTKQFTAGYAESGAYVGVALLLMIALVARSRLRDPAGGLLLWVLAVAVIASFGPTLHIGGRALAPMPWKVAMLAPLLRQALPARLMLYALLCLALLAAIWLHSATARPAARRTLAALSVLLFIPTPSVPVTSLDTPRFFSDALYRQYLQEGETALVIPYGANGPSMLWQAQSGMDFRLAAGYLGTVSQDFFRWPINDTFYSGRLIPHYGQQLRAYLSAHRVGGVVVVDGTAGPWTQVFSTLGVQPVHTGGVAFYRVPGTLVTGPATLPPLEMEMRSALALFDALIGAADAYLAQGLDPRALTPLIAEGRGWLPSFWGGYPTSRGGEAGGQEYWTRTGLRLGPWQDGTIGVALWVPSHALGPLVARYRPYAKAIYFPFPQPLAGDVRDGHGLLLMVFTPGGIAQAATTQ